MSCPPPDPLDAPGEALRRMDFPKRKRGIGGPASMAHSPSHFEVMGPGQQIPTSSVTADLNNVVGAPCSEKIGRAPPR